MKPDPRLWEAHHPKPPAERILLLDAYGRPLTWDRDAWHWGHRMIAERHRFTWPPPADAAPWSVCSTDTDRWIASRYELQPEGAP